MSDAIAQEAQERREGHRTLSLQIEEVRGDVHQLKVAVANVQIDTKVIRKRARRDVGGLKEEMAKANRRLMALATAAMVYAFGAVPEVRELALALAKKVFHL